MLLPPHLPAIWGERAVNSKETVMKAETAQNALGAVMVVGAAHVPGIIRLAEESGQKINIKVAR